MKNLFALLALLPATHALADTALPASGDLVEIQGAAAALRSSTPDSLLGAASQVGWVKKGETVRVLETRQYLSMFGTEIWVEVQKEDDSSLHGWIFDGIGKEIVAGKGLIQVTQAARATTAVPASAPGAARPEEPSDAQEATASAAAKDGDRLVKELLP